MTPATVSRRRKPGTGGWRTEARAALARAAGPQAHGSFGATGLFALLAAAGLLLVALGNNDAREGGGDAQMLFWAGLVLIYTPIVLRLFSPKSSRTECLALSMLLGGSLFMVKVLYNPIGLIPHDEMASLRQTWELFTTGHFFSANPVVQGYAGYPGLEAVTAPLAQLSRTNTYVAAMIVIGVARVTLILALFLFLERVTGSYRVAGIGIAVYVSNPSFLYFDSQFGYESLALPIGAALVLVSLRWASAPRAERRLNTRGILAAMAVLAATVVATHHLTSYSVLAFLVIWALTIEFGRRDGVFPAVPATYGADPSAPPLGPALPALFTGAAIAFWLLVVAGSVTANELGSVIAGAFESAIDLLTGQGGSKALFEAGHGETNSTVARILGVASIIPLLFVIPFGLRRTWMRRGSNAMWRALAVVAALYPITLVLRLTQAGTETSQRASEFVFVGLAFVAGLLIVERRQHAKPGWMALRQLGLAAIATVVFLGGFIVGESPVTRQPGPYLVAAESRSVSPQALAAARFADEHLPPRSRILVDRVNGVLMAAIGHLDPVIGSVKGIPVSQVFFSRRYGRKDQVVISDDAIDYIVVDRRFIERLPVSGYYYEKDEPSGGKPISREALQKFANLDGLTRIFDNGAIAIYDTAGLRSRPR